LYGFLAYSVLLPVFSSRGALYILEEDIRYAFFDKGFIRKLVFVILHFPFQDINEYHTYDVSPLLLVFFWVQQSVHRQEKINGVFPQ
jgi:hypothetical protein